MIMDYRTDGQKNKHQNPRLFFPPDAAIRIKYKYAK